MNKRAAAVGVIFLCAFLFTTFRTFAGEAKNTTWQIINDVDEILKNNPMPAGEKSQMIKLAEDDTVSVYLIRMLEGASLGPHFHKTHDEIEYVIRGTGKLLVQGKWLDMKPGTFHFNPPMHVHGSQNMGKEPLVVLIMFTPAMKETDRHFLSQ